jgi:polyhydroxyalkanoate synthesis regulator phasin
VLVTEYGDSENGDSPGPSLQQLMLAGIGWASEGVETVDAFADELSRRVGVERDKMRTALQETIDGFKREAERLGVRTDELSERTLGRVGLARRESVEDLELRVAQLEHRLRLLERGADSGDGDDAP